MNNSTVKSEKRIRFCPTWNLLAPDDSVIASYSEAQLKISGIIVSLDIPFDRQWERISLMEIGDCMATRKVENNYSVQAKTHTFGRLVRVA